jgi:hypothetical protein
MRPEGSSSKLQHRAPSKVPVTPDGDLSHLKKTLDTGVPVLPVSASLEADGQWRMCCAGASPTEVQAQTAQTCALSSSTLVARRRATSQAEKRRRRDFLGTFNKHLMRYLPGVSLGIRRCSAHGRAHGSPSAGQAPHVRSAPTVFVVVVRILSTQKTARVRFSCT